MANHNQVDALLRHPEVWEHCALEVLEQLVLQTLLRYGTARNSASMVPTVMALYQVWCQRAPAQRRMALLNEITDAVDAGAAAAWTLNAFLFKEDHVSLIATAALHYAWNTPLTDPSDPISGVRQVIHQLQSAPRLAPRAKAGILRGLVTLGDRRVMRALRPCWRVLPEAALDDFVNASTGVPLAGSIDLLLDWTSAAIDADAELHLSAFIAALVRSRTGALTDAVYEDQRRFPLFKHQDAPLFNQRAWSFEDYAEQIRPRLEALWRREPEPKLLGHALAAWGLPVPEAPPSSEPTRQWSPAAERMAALAWAVLEDARENPFPPEERALRATGLAFVLGVAFFSEDRARLEVMEDITPFCPAAALWERNGLADTLVTSLMENRGLQAFLDQTLRRGSDPVPVVAGWLLQALKEHEFEHISVETPDDLLTLADQTLRFTGRFVETQPRLASAMLAAISNGD